MIFLRKHFVFAVLCLLCVAGCKCARADDASRRAKVKEIFVLIHLQETIEQTQNEQQTQMRKSLSALLPLQKQATPEQQADIDNLMIRTSAFLRDTLSWQKLEPQYVDLYVSTYTEEELDGMIAFYRSPVGRSVMAKQPGIIAKSQAITQERLQEEAPKLRNLILQFAAEQAQKRSTAAPHN